MSHPSQSWKIREMIREIDMENPPRCSKCGEPLEFASPIGCTFPCIPCGMTEPISEVESNGAPERT